jgi:hypothetical protein
MESDDKGEKGEGGQIVQGQTNVQSSKSTVQSWTRINVERNSPQDKRTLSTENRFQGRFAFSCTEFR